MRYACVLLCILVGCGFHPAAATDGPPGDDAADDAAPDTPGQIPIRFVREAVVVGTGDAVTGSLATQDAGDAVIAVVSWTNNNHAVTGVTDAQGNPWMRAAPLKHSGQLSLEIWWTPSVAAGANPVTATLDSSVTSPKLRLFEYAGLVNTPVDDAAVASTSDPGAALSTSSVGPITVTGHDLLFAANVTNRTITAIGDAYVQRQLDDGDVVIDREVVATGVYTASATLSSSASWVMTLVAFKGDR